MQARTRPDRAERPALSTVVGANLHRIRENRVPRYRMEDFAADAGLHIETVRVIEAGRDPTKRQLKLRSDTLDALADALDVDVAELVRWPMPPSPSGKQKFEIIHGKGRRTLGGQQVPLMSSAK